MEGFAPEVAWVTKSGESKLEQVGPALTALRQFPSTEDNSFCFRTRSLLLCTAHCGSPDERDDHVPGFCELDPKPQASFPPLLCTTEHLPRA